MRTATGSICNGGRPRQANGNYWSQKGGHQRNPGVTSHQRAGRPPNCRSNGSGSNPISLFQSQNCRQSRLLKKFITLNKDRGWKICQGEKRNTRPCNLKLHNIRAFANDNIVPIVKKEGSSSSKCTIVDVRQRIVEELHRIRRTKEGKYLKNRW
jgi:hypothetical protein